MATQHAQGMAERRARILIAGAGVAGLEALYGLRALAGDRVELALVAPEAEFVYRPLGVSEPFDVGRVRQVPLMRAALQAGAVLVRGTVEAVDARRRFVTTSDDEELEYDALLLAVGARVLPVVPNAMTWDDRADWEAFGGLLRDIDEGYVHSVAVVIPAGPVWPLRGYELAMHVALEAKNMSADHQTTLITPRSTPLELLGPRAVASISRELARAEIDVESADRVDVEPGHPHTVVLHPSGRRVEGVARVLALPELRGRSIHGIPTDPDGFIDVDEHCRVRSLQGVWAAGDGTAFPLKSGGFAAAQADAAARDMAATAGAAVEAEPFEPEAPWHLAGLPAGRHLEAQLFTDDDADLATHLPANGVPVLKYLIRDLAGGRRGTH
jgi:sulfide:quinone oxidoreductase